MHSFLNFKLKTSKCRFIFNTFGEHKLEEIFSQFEYFLGPFGKLWGHFGPFLGHFVKDILKRTFWKGHFEKNILKRTFWKWHFENDILKRTFWKEHFEQKFKFIGKINTPILPNWHQCQTFQNFRFRSGEIPVLELGFGLALSFWVETWPWILILKCDRFKLAIITFKSDYNLLSGNSDSGRIRVIIMVETVEDVRFSLFSDFLCFWSKLLVFFKKKFQMEFFDCFFWNFSTIFWEFFDFFFGIFCSFWNFNIFWNFSIFLEFSIFGLKFLHFCWNFSIFIHFSIFYSFFEFSPIFRFFRFFFQFFNFLECFIVSSIF